MLPLTEIHPPDGGLIYTETNLHHLFPEPLNMVTSALFLIPGIYWLIKLRGFSRQYSFLSVANYLMLTGCIGGIIYHGLRRWHFFILMDWVPIALVCLAASVYFWMKLLGRWIYGIIALALFIVLETLMLKLMPETKHHLAINLNYAVMVLMIVLPLALLLIKTRGYNWTLVALALLAFAVALSFRIYDRFAPWAIGTHFLWHTFGAIAASLMFMYLYRLRERKEIANNF